MIKLGSSVKRINLGAGKVKKALLGDKLIWKGSEPKILEGEYRYDIDLTDTDFFKPYTKYKFTVSDSEEYNFFYWIDGKSEGKTFNSELIFNIVNCTKIAIVNKGFKYFTLTIEEV